MCTLVVVAVASVVIASADEARAGEAGRVTELMTQALPNVPGKEVTMITVDYAPGAVDPVHRHDGAAFLYVLEGTIEMQMEGGQKVTLEAGETFYEEPGRVHAVGRNTSDTKPAKFVVVLVKDRGTPLLEVVEP
ncbi:MAG TPA: cupin domain-containing protein [Candidatus Binatia bacterium]